MIEVLVWTDLKLEGIAFTGVKSWWYRAARIMEMMEKEGIVGQANHVGKREIL